MAKIDDELVNACQGLLKELKRVELEKEKKREEERQASEIREARREYWREKLYSEDSKGMTFIVPDDSKLKK
jgi:hypothetical protein